MISGIYTSASGMMHEMLKQEITTENIARCNNIGYKKREVVSQVFPKAFANVIEDELSSGPKIINTLRNGVLLSRVVETHKAGPLEYTGNPLDVAIHGDGFFVIDTPQGTAYTRNGTFSLNGNNELVTMEGCRVMGEGGPIIVNNEKSQEIKIDDLGNILVGDDVVEKIKIVDFDKPYKLAKSGVTTYTALPGANERPSPESTVAQGYLERANLSIVEEMTGMIETQRTYEMNASMLKAQEDTLTKAINSVGSPK